MCLGSIIMRHDSILKYNKDKVYMTYIVIVTIKEGYYNNYYYNTWYVSSLHL